MIREAQPDNATAQFIANVIVAIVGGLLIGVLASVLNVEYLSSDYWTFVLCGNGLFAMARYFKSDFLTQ